MWSLRPKSLALALVIAAAIPAAAATAGVVTHVRDGDTFEVGSVPIRLNGLHAPELAAGPESARRNSCRTWFSINRSAAA